MHLVNANSTLNPSLILQPPAGNLKRVYTLVHVTGREAPSVSLFSMLLMLGRLAPAVGLSSMDADDLRGLTLDYLKGDSPGDD